MGAFFFILSVNDFAQDKNKALMNTPAPHGGQMSQTGNNYFIELSFSTVETYAYLYDSLVKPISNSGITGKIIFKGYDYTLATVELEPFQGYAFVAKTNVPPYLSCEVQFDLNGKKVSSQFDYSESIADKRK